MIALKRRRDVASYLRWAAVAAVGDAHYEAWMTGLIDVMHAGIRNFSGRTLPLPQKLAPSQAAQLTSTHARERGQVPERFKRSAADVAQEPGELMRFPEPQLTVGGPTRLGSRS